MKIKWSKREGKLTLTRTRKDGDEPLKPSTIQTLVDFGFECVKDGDQEFTFVDNLSPYNITELDDTELIEKITELNMKVTVTTENGRKNIKWNTNIENLGASEGPSLRESLVGAVSKWNRSGRPVMGKCLLEAVNETF